MLVSWQLIDVVKHVAAEEDFHDELIKKINAINTSKLVNKTEFNPKTKDIEDITPSITDLTTASALKIVENKIPEVSTLVKKAYYDAGIKNIMRKVLLLIIINMQIMYLI